VPLNKTDRAVETEAWFKRLMGERSGADRLRMACDMFDLGIALIVGSLPPEIAKDRRKRRLAVLQRMYWPEREEPFLKTAVERLGTHPEFLGDERG